MGSLVGSLALSMKDARTTRLKTGARLNMAQGSGFRGLGFRVYGV